MDFAERCQDVGENHVFWRGDCSWRDEVREHNQVLEHGKELSRSRVTMYSYKQPKPELFHVTTQYESKVGKSLTSCNSAGDDSLILLARPHRWTRRLVCLRCILDLAQVNKNSRVVALVRAWQACQRPRRSVPAVRNRDLRARKVELRFVGLHRHMKCDMLYAEEIIATRCSLGDCGVGCFVLVYYHESV